MKQKLLNSIKLRAMMLVAVMCAVFTGSAWATDITYTFTSKSWTATVGGSAANWTSGADGAGFSNNGIQVTTTASGANGTSPTSFSNISAIVLTYNTNKSAGSGTAKVKIGTNAETSKIWGYSGSSDGRTANFTLTYSYATPQTGNVKITLETSTNSIYLVSCKITYAAGFTVTYNANGATSGTVPTDASSPYASGATVTVKGNTGSLAKSGYVFGGWNTKADGTGDNYDAGETFSISSNTTLYAKWNAKTITELSKTGTPTKTTYYAGESFDPTGLEVTATYNDESNEDVTTSVAWTPDPLTKGTTSVTGTFMGETVSVTGLTVTAAPGSSERPYTVAEAMYAIDNSGTTSDVYVSGIVCNGGSNYYSSSKLTYYISADGTTTNRFQIYRGLGLNGASFSGTSDIQVGDIVTVRGDILLYNKTTYEFSEGSQITSFKRKANSDLTITSSAPVALEITSAELNPTSNITWTTTSTGAMSFESNATGVATVSAAGVITAVGAGAATITISQAADDDYKASGNKTVTVNVTDNRSVCATGIDLTSANTILKGNNGALAATSTATDGFTGSITYSYESANSDVFSITDGNYTGAGVGATTVTITATPTGGNAANYKPASQEVAVTVNGTNSISLDPTSKTIAFSASTFDIAATIPTDNYDGSVSAESNNESVATVSVDGTTVTVTPVAVGSARITVTAGTGTYYLATAQANCDVEFTVPAGSTKAPSPEVKVFEETFNGCTGEDGNTGGNDDKWNGSIASATITAGTHTATGWSFTNAKGANKCAKFGTSSAGGSATTPSIDLEEGIIYTLTFKAGAWDKDGEGTSLSVSASNATIKNEANTATVSSVTTVKGEWTSYTLKVIVTDESDPVTITFSTSGANKRFFLDEVKVFYEEDPTATVKLNTYGLATYCSVNPIDFSSTSGYTAWRVNDIAADGTITFKKITEKIKGGQGVLLYNKNAGGVATNATIAFADGTIEFDNEDGDGENNNYLVGTTAPTNVAANAVYGLSGNKFVKSSEAGNIPAGKAYILATSIPAEVKNFTFVFEDETTGITETRQATREEVEAIFNLGGQRLQKMQRGINIVNGKKILVK